MAEPTREEMLKANNGKANCLCSGWCMFYLHPGLPWSWVLAIIDGLGVIANIIADGARKAITFYVDLFKVTSKPHMYDASEEDKRICHSAVTIQEKAIYVVDDGLDHIYPKPLHGPSEKHPANLVLHVNIDKIDVDALHKKAVDAGCKELKAPTDMFWGDRYSVFEDPFGYAWALCGRDMKVVEGADKEKAEAMKETNSGVFVAAPSESSGVIPSLFVSDGKGAIKFYKSLFEVSDADVFEFDRDGKIMHGMVVINGRSIYVADEGLDDIYPSKLRAGSQKDPSAMLLNVNVTEEQLDAIHARALQSGAKELRSKMRMYWGDLYSMFIDPYGFIWALCASPSDNKHGREDGADAAASAPPKSSSPKKDESPKASARPKRAAAKHK
jgi:PhnB protein